LSRRARTRRWRIAAGVLVVIVSGLIDPLAGIAAFVIGLLVLVAWLRPDEPRGYGPAGTPDLRRADDTSAGGDVRDTGFGHIIGLPPGGGGC